MDSREIRPIPTGHPKMRLCRWWWLLHSAALGSSLTEGVTIMKRRMTCLIVGVVSGVLSLGVRGSGTSKPSAQGDAALAQLTSRGLSASLQEAVTAARYGVYAEPQHTATWYAENPAQQIRARFTADGLQMQGTSGDGRSQHVGLALRSVGYGARQIGVSAARVTTTGNRIAYARTLAGGEAGRDVTELYVNTAAGLEHGMTLASAPGARRPGERLRVALALDGEWRAQAVESGQALEFLDGAGQRRLRYDIWWCGTATGARSKRA